MNVLRFRRYDLLVSCACLGLLSSFSWYALVGPRGYDYKDLLQLKLATAQAETVILVAERDQLEKRVHLMRPESIDADLLEEMARRDLKMLHPSELIVKVQN